MANTVALIAGTELSQKIAARAADRKGGTIKNMMEGRSDVYKVNPFLIQVQDGFNVRDFESPEVAEHVDNLARSIAQIGVQRPLKVRNKGGELILKDGECRLRATIRAIEVYKAEIVAIPVQLTDRSESDADAALGILVENSGLDITVAGKAEIVKRLMGFGWNSTEIAEKAGMSKARVSQLLDFAGLSTAIKALVSAGTISATAAMNVARENAFDDDKTLAQIVAAQTKVAANGRARVTAKTLGGPSKSAPSLKAAVAEIINKADVEKLKEGTEDATVILTMSAAEYGALCNLLKLVG